MSIPAGTRFGRYEILALIGAGGMGEVAPDGQRFRFVKRADAERVQPTVDVVVNWAEELNRRLPTR